MYFGVLTLDQSASAFLLLHLDLHQDPDLFKFNINGNILCMNIGFCYNGNLDLGEFVDTLSMIQECHSRLHREALNTNPPQ